MKSLQNHSKEIIRQYARNIDLYEDFAYIVQVLLVSFLKNRKISFHSISYRVKEVHKLKEKIRRKKSQGKHYRSIDDISDLAGVRIILYFQDDIKKVIRIIEKEFRVHKKENFDSDAKALLRAKSFGYSAKHRIVSLNKYRNNLNEYQRFAGLKCEIQVRTILQHAWAEIEHDIGYKPQLSEKDPQRKIIREAFAENANLLKDADEKFIEVRKMYEALLKKYQEKINKNKSDIPLNIDSVKTYLLSKGVLDKKIVTVKDSLVAEHFNEAKRKGIKSIREFDKYYKEKFGQ